MLIRMRPKANYASRGRSFSTRAQVVNGFFLEFVEVEQFKIRLMFVDPATNSTAKPKVA
jgi:hypothetical protein